MLIIHINKYTTLYCIILLLRTTIINFLMFNVFKDTIIGLQYKKVKLK